MVLRVKIIFWGAAASALKTYDEDDEFSPHGLLVFSALETAFVQFISGYGQIHHPIGVHSSLTAITYNPLSLTFCHKSGRACLEHLTGISTNKPFRQIRSYFRVHS